LSRPPDFSCSDDAPTERRCGVVRLEEWRARQPPAQDGECGGAPGDPRLEHDGSPGLHAELIVPPPAWWRGPQLEE
jgi:hypothetical protein